jgi:hypothetical protein
MVSNKQSLRAFIAFLVTWSFAVLGVTGLVLYIVPQGRVAFWTHWSLLGLGKTDWGNVHMLFGGVFIVTGILHLYFNWKPFKKYLAERVKGHLELKRELVTSLGATLLLTAAAIANLPPISWVFDLNGAIKDSWASKPGHAPPFGHAEEVALPALAKRADFDLEAALGAFAAAGMDVANPRANLARIARDNDTTPAALYALIPSNADRLAERTPDTDPMEVEGRLAGSGIGGKTLQDFAKSQGIASDVALQRLEAVHIGAAPEERIKVIAERAGTRPIEIAKALLVLGYRPEPME